MILYPPIIGDIVPAFTITDGIVINFTNNPAINLANVKSLQLSIKELNSPYVIAYSTITDLNIVQLQKGQVLFTNFYDTNDQTWYPQKNTYYKFQMSYGDQNNTDTTQFKAFSSVAIGKCIGDKPIIYIEGLDNTSNVDQGIYIGQYEHPDDLNETLYSYRFYVTDENTILQDTGEILYNNNLMPQMKFKLQYELEPQITTYEINFSIITINGYQSTVTYSLIANQTGNVPEFNIVVSQDTKAQNNGYIQLALTGTPAVGTYVIERRAGAKVWEELIQFAIPNEVAPVEYTWRDYTVEHGVTYRYALRQVNNNVYGPRKLANTNIMVEFEDMFLSDETTQLKIKFDPKVSSFKNTIQEQKMDTIGSKYPFFFRNGMVNYKEIPLSGLISYQMDDNELFASNDELGLPSSAPDALEREFTSTNLTGINIAAERKFKLKVLDWLTNGQPKLFRSPTEGNYIIRLMNVSLSPNDTLGRMLHSFSATGYEVANCDMANMLTEQIIYTPNSQQSISVV